MAMIGTVSALVGYAVGLILKVPVVPEQPKINEAGTTKRRLRCRPSGVNLWLIACPHTPMERSIMTHTSNAALSRNLTANHVDLALIPISADLQYLTGIPRDMPNFGNVMYPGAWLEGLFLTPAGRQVFTVTRMTATFHMDTRGKGEVRILGDAADPLALARDVMQTLGIRSNARIAIGERAWAESVINLRAVLPDAAFVSATRLLRPLRAVKDADELAILRRAGEITESAFADVRAQIKAGMTELDLMSEVDYQIRRMAALRLHSPPPCTTWEHPPAWLTAGPWRIPAAPVACCSFGAVYEATATIMGEPFCWASQTPNTRRSTGSSWTRRPPGLPRSRQGRPPASRLTPLHARSSRTRDTASTSCTAWGMASAWTYTSRPS
jgi:hypothetical protein